MRKSYFDYLSEFRGHFQGTELSKPDLEAMLVFELMIVGCRLSDPDVPIQEAWSVLMGYDDPILPVLVDKSIVHRLRVLFRDLRTERKWNDVMQLYRTIDPVYLLFEWQDGELVKRTPLLFSEREDWYEQKLRNPVEHKPRNPEFVQKGEFTYKRWLTSDISREYKGIIPFEPEVPSFLPIYREKRKSQFRVDHNFKLAALREVSTAMEVEERNLTESIRLLSLSSPKENSFQYEGLKHLIGGLGAGKTRFMLNESVRLVKNEGAHIGFIESSVAQVLKRVEELKLVGINAVPIIGRSNRDLYERQLLTSKKGQFQDLAIWGDSQGGGLSHLSSFCIIHALADDDQAGSDFPCKRIVQKKEQCSCPFASKCGVYQDYTRLAEAEVWVTTSSSVLKTRLPAFIDPLERSIFEAMYDLLDVIFVDEADEVQKQFDSSFINEYSLFGDTGDLFESLFKDSMNVTLGRYAEYAGDRDIDYWNQLLSTMERVTRAGIYEKLVRSPRLSEFVRRRMIRMTTITFQVSRACSTDENEQIGVFQQLTRYVDEPLDQPYFQVVENLMQARNQQEKRAILDQFLASIQGSFRPTVDRELWYEVLEFFLYLARADYCMKEIKDLFPIIKAKLYLTSDLHPQFAVQQDLRPFMKDAMTGAMTGYSYDVRNGQTVGTFKLVEYNGVGRLLLQEWHQVYEFAGNKKGPAVVLLSGTSYAPGSPHYNLEITPTWLLERQHDEPVITQHFWPVYDEDPDQALFVSGIFDRDQRNKSIQTMTRKLLRKVSQELLEWRKAGTNRKVLIIVNSYEDVETVGLALNGETEWKGRYKLLSRELSGNDETAFSRSNLESFHQEKADLLVAPLMSINRGYNILDERQGSLFGSVFFLIRPYPIPNDIGYLVQMIHAKHSKYLEEIQRENIYYGQAIKLLRKKSNSYFHFLYERPDFWAQLHENDRKTIAWFTFVPIWQTIGRMIRNGSEARVFYCDAKFNKAPKNENSDESMLGYWKRLMTENSHKPEFVSLYGSFIDSIQTIRGVEVE